MLNQTVPLPLGAVLGMLPKPFWEAQVETAHAVREAQQQKLDARTVTVIETCTPEDPPQVAAVETVRENLYIPFTVPEVSVTGRHQR